ncbi:threonine and homoserine efflux system [Shewanella putrefaciens]|uniref:DMT family transporter n=1 Tax=Shewanella putrefaciens TaxID=24 RepID=UPI000E04C96C|nr:DMT family transporter [Shewanella putrefaciens]SUI83562.1 threonine and homoserine efflux system [Shewanella putrefaciens]
MGSITKPSGLIELHLAVLMFGGTALFSKLIPLSALDITFWRCIAAALILALLIKFSRKPLSLEHKHDYLIAIALGIIVSLHWVTYFAAMQLSSVAIGMIAFFTYPVMTVIAEPLLTGNKIKLIDMISGILVFIGVILLIPEANFSNDTTLGIAIGILSAMLFTARNLLQKRYFTQYSGPHAMFYQTLVAAVFLMPWHETPLNSITLDVWELIILLGIVFTAAPHALFTSALRQLSAKTVGLVSCLQPFYGAMLALMILGETLNLNTLLGGTIIVATAIFETHQSHQSLRRKKRI